MPRVLAESDTLRVSSNNIPKREKLDFNRGSPCSLMLPQPEFWVGNIKAAEDWCIHKELGLRAIWTVANIHMRGRPNRSITYMPKTDINEVVEGNLPFAAFLDELLVLDNHLEMKGSALVHCLQGANRSGVVACAYIIGKCQVKAALALRYTQRIRPIIDVADAAWGMTVLPGQWLERHEEEIIAAFAKRVTINLPLLVSPQTFRSLVDMDAIEARKKEQAENCEVQHLREELEKLKEERSRSPASGQALIDAIAQNDVDAVNKILDAPDADANYKSELARHCSYNGMTPLHHACRMMVRTWARKLLEWEPAVANETTYQNAKPKQWTPLQCLIDNPVMEVLTIEQAKAMVSDLVDHMNEAAVRNQTGFMERGGGKRTGGLNVLHALVSRKSPLFFHTADQIRAKFGNKVAIEMMNTTTGDGRGVVDMALGSNVQLAHDVKHRFKGAVEQRANRRSQEEEKGGRRQWQHGDSDWKNPRAANDRSDTAQWERGSSKDAGWRSRSRGWNEDWREGWMEKEEPSDDWVDGRGRSSGRSSDWWDR